MASPHSSRLNRWLDRRHRDDEDDTPPPQPQRVTDIEYRAIEKLFETNSAALEEWRRYREEFEAEEKKAQQDKAA